MSKRAVPFRLMNYRQRGETGGLIQVGLAIDERILPLEALVTQYPAAQRLIEASRRSELAPGVQSLLNDFPFAAAKRMAQNGKSF